MEDPREKEEKKFLTEVAELDEALEVLDSSLSHINWRLKYTRRRLETDILALCTGLRPVIMVDYGGKMPELQERLCGLLKLCQKESPIFVHLRVMVIEEMIYLVHIRGLADHVRSSLNSDRQLLFVDLEQDPLEIIAEAEKSPLVMQLKSIQKFFSLLFPLGGRRDDATSSHSMDNMVDTKPPTNELIPSQSSDFIDLSSCMQNTQLPLPTLNGWLLGYPVAYLFSKEHGMKAVRNLSTKSLHIYKISVCRNGTPNKESQLEELLSFTVPYDLSMEGSKEKWAEAFWADMRGKWEICKQGWMPLEMEIYSQDNAYYTDLLYGRSDSHNAFPTCGYMLDDESSNQSLISSEVAAQTDSTAKKAQRTRNFSTDEDGLLVAAWLNVGSGALEGKKEKGGAYWNRMWEYFHKAKKFTSERSANSLMHRWSGIQLAVKRFCGYYAEVNVQCGVSEQDRIIQAMEMFRQMQDHAFQYIHCWHVLKDDKKWMALSSRKKSKISKIVSPATSPSTPYSVNREVDVSNDISISLERPIGMMATENPSKTDPNHTFPTYGYMSVDKSSNEACVSSQVPAQIESTKMEQRCRNFSVDEDNLLVTVWLSVGLDADNGDEQKSGAYWKRIWQYFHKEKKSTFERTADSLMERCSAIQLAVSTFYGYYAQIEALKQIGVNEQDRIIQAMEMYQQMQGHSFQFLHCWQVLKHNRTWMVDSSKKKRKYSKNAGLETSSPPDSISLREDNVASDTSISLERPPGRMVVDNLFRKEKDGDHIQESSNMPPSIFIQEFSAEKKEMERQRNENFRLRYTLDQELLSIKREKLRMEQLKEEERIMLIDTTGLPQMQAEYYKFRQMEIMAKKVGSSLN